ncbi:MAG TPA: GDSL-type esterase/lipase family protein [Methanoregulaceae archaeon]|nr:GDSL-type esterase/lipase family protein [Methanoregulaceae archaeon]HOV67369.1 GDSL-type esterase/lipase family protein [Methanoregulaceae archaeon]HQJ88219.1 GDSL-type esterase/lipase family protein [Methanoregulaceae archaeon]
MFTRTRLLVLVLVAALVLPAGATVRILPLGDSITRGDPSPDSDAGSYRYYLYTRLVDAGYRVDFIGSTTQPNFSRFSFDQDHDGHGGYTTGMFLSYQGQEPLREWLAASGAPDIVLLHIGTNDAVWQVDHGTRLENLAVIVRILQETNPRVTILLAQIIPTDNWFRNQRQIDPFNAALPGLAANVSTASSRVIVVDQNSGFDGVNDTQADGIHPNAEGMKKIAATWYRALVPLLPAPSTTPFTVPGGVGPARPLPGEGLYRDVNGNGRADFADVVLLFSELDWCAANAPGAFDFNANGRVDFADVVRLFEAL